MENPKKKRSEVTGDGRTSGKKTRTKTDRFNGGVTAEDAELEEFLAIINRLQAGFDRFKDKDAGNCVGKPAAPTDFGTMNPGFEVEDFIQLHDGRRKTGAGDLLQNGVVFAFDLNAEPASDPVRSG